MRIQVRFKSKVKAIVKSILFRNWVFGPCYVNDLAFRGVEFHVPFMSPAFKVVTIKHIRFLCDYAKRTAWLNGTILMR